MKVWPFLLFFLMLLGAPEQVLAEGGVPHLDGASLSLWWVLPFIGMLLSIALCPLLVPQYWAHNIGKTALAWSVCFLLPCLILKGASVALYTVLHTLFFEYLPFIILLFALFTIAGGIRMTGSIAGTPKANTLILLAGTCLASIMGTTGAAMLLIRPLLRSNAHRRYQTHTVIFFIFLVANIGGSLTPLGDPPLFLGFLHGVSFFWTTTHLLAKTIFMVAFLMGIYIILDCYLYKKEGCRAPEPVESPEKFGFAGKINFLLILGVVALVLMSGLWKTELVLPVWLDITIALPDLFRDLGLLALAGLSWVLTSQQTRKANYFNWEPIEEVGKLFIGIFITMAPAIVILRAGEEGAFSGLLAMVTGENGQPNNHMYFWLTGILSSFLDNAPTYVVFFNVAGGDANTLMNQLPQTLAAISAGAVFMGANTYIGNAPNFMVRAIAVSHGVKMPSFFGYMLWSGAILIPLFILLNFLFF